MNKGVGGRGRGAEVNINVKDSQEFLEKSKFIKENTVRTTAPLLSTVFFL